MEKIYTLLFLLMMTLGFGIPAFGQGDTPCSAVILTSGTIVSGSTSGLTETDDALAPNPPCAGFLDGGNCLDAWYQLTTPSGGDVLVSLTNVAGGTGSTASFALYTGTSCSGLMFESCGSNDLTVSDQLLTGLAAGTVVWIRIWDYFCNENKTFDLRATNLAPGDEPCNALALTNAVPSTGSTSPFTETDVALATNPTCGGFTDNGDCWDTWYKYDVPGNGGDVTVSLTDVTGGTGSTASYAVYRGSDCSNLLLWGCGTNDVAPTDQTLLGLPINSSIWIRVWDFNCDPAPKSFDLTATLSNENTDIILNEVSTGANIVLDCGLTYKFYDSGGAFPVTFADNTYANDEDYTITFTAPAGNQIWVKEISATLTCPGKVGGFAPCADSDGNDYMQVFDGTNLVKNVVGNGGGRLFGNYKSVSGSITIDWTSTAVGVNGGWEFEVRCVPEPTTNTLTNVPCGGSVQFTDPGGVAGNYGNNAHEIWTFCPEAGCAEHICADMGMTDFEDLFDAIYVFDGDNADAPLHSYYQESMNTVMGTLRASPDNASGCLTFMLISDAGIDQMGWNSTIGTCEPIGPNGAEDCVDATDISSPGVYQSNTFTATGLPFDVDPDLNIGSGTCDPTNDVFSDVTQLENTIWYKFTTPTIMCQAPFFTFGADNVSCFQQGVSSGAQFVLYETNACLTSTTWDAARIYCADVIQSGGGVDIPDGVLQPGTTYYVMMDAFGGRQCDLDLIVNVVTDIDGDGVCDEDDIDDDNDGIPDVVEIGCAVGTTMAACAPNGDPLGDHDFDGTPNYQDPDLCTLNAAGICEDLDQDADGIPNFLDLDSDNDGIPDIVEAGGTDSDNDGIVDCITADCDADDDGLFDGADVAPGAATTTTSWPIPNTDTNGNADFLDLDADDDGIPDTVEALGEDTDNDGMVDGPNCPLSTTCQTDANNNGWADIYDNGSPLVDTDLNDPSINAGGSSAPNHLDLDSDGDGCYDTVEGAGVDEDTDDDGIIGATGLTINDTDGDGWSDITDSDDGGTAFPYPEATPSTPDFLNGAEVHDACSATLPLELHTFEATMQDCSALLQWVTSNEENIRSFVVEKSHDGLKFTSITTIPAKGGMEEARYQFTDKAFQAHHYYRLKIIEYDESFAYSRLLALSSDCIENILIQSLYPNPTKEELTYVLYSPTGGTVSISVVDALGKETYLAEQELVRGPNIHQLNLEVLSSGTYFLKLILEDKTVQSAPFVKLE